jgi:protein tyrosine phosphatase (PTP) superfamily phosphohydrolase (DUF442 family)
MHGVRLASRSGPAEVTPESRDEEPEMNARRPFPTLRTLSTRSWALVGALVVTACGGGAEDAPQPADDGAVEVAAAPASLEQVQALGIRNAAMPVAGLVTAAQPTQDQLDRLVSMGYDRFISLRPTTEDGAGWEEAHVTGAEATFARIPVSGASGLTRENVAELDRLLDEADDGTVLYCASSNRVGALLALRAYWMDNASPEEALALGREAGLASLEGRVTELLAEPR